MFNLKIKKMEKQVLFKEVQKQTQKWIWFLVIIITITTLFGGIQQIIFNVPYGNADMPDWAFFLLLIIPAILFYILVKSNLYTEITNDYILFHYKPFLRKP